MKIVYEPIAVAQLDAIFAHVHQRNPQGARKIASLIKRSIDRLTQFPRSGRQSEVAEIRELPIVRYPYIVFYAVNDTAHEVHILRVRHTSQDPAHHLD